MGFPGSHLIDGKLEAIDPDPLVCPWPPAPFLYSKSHFESTSWIKSELLGAKGMDMDVVGDMDVCRDLDVSGIWTGTRKQDELKPGHL